MTYGSGTEGISVAEGFVFLCTDRVSSVRLQEGLVHCRERKEVSCLQNIRTITRGMFLGDHLLRPYKKREFLETWVGKKNRIDLQVEDPYL